jgi:hypothetical protein
MTGKDGKDGKVFSLIFPINREFRKVSLQSYVMSWPEAAKTFPSFPSFPVFIRIGRSAANELRPSASQGPSVVGTPAGCAPAPTLARA